MYIVILHGPYPYLPQVFPSLATQTMLIGQSCIFPRHKLHRNTAAGFKTEISNPPIRCVRVFGVTAWRLHQRLCRSFVHGACRTVTSPRQGSASRRAPVAPRGPGKPVGHCRTLPRRRKTSISEVDYHNQIRRCYSRPLLSDYPPSLPPVKFPSHPPSPTPIISQTYISRS